MTNKEVSQYVENEGLGYAISHGMSGNDIKDPILKEKWKQAQKLLGEIESMLPDPYDDDEPDNDEEFGLRRFGP